ncbi:MAG: PIG-L family deacetylase [Pseudonocardiaceae bacterium]
MATLVAFHAHPDDESIGGGTLARASAEGHRVVVLLATRGERGETPPGLLAPVETLAQRRVTETLQATSILGVHRVEFLNYRDSGMRGADTYDDPGCFRRADVDQAARELAVILTEEQPGALLIYDETGITGHPDHIQVHRVGVRAAALVAVPRVYEGTMSRSRIQWLVSQAIKAGLTRTSIDIDPQTFGTPDEAITTTIDVRRYLPLKRRAMAAHASQISETSPLLAMPPEVFEQLWGYESAIRQGAPPGLRETHLFASPLAGSIG